jgi:[CysO sulfur-carrier protein]-S-L-cysteine hydrolase
MDALRLTREQTRRMIEYVQAVFPQEACGLLVGENNTVLSVLPVPNKSDNPGRHFVMDEQALFKALRLIDSRKQSLLAIYHSHPVSDPIPSREDIEAAYEYPNVLHVIVSLKHDAPRLKAWRILPGQVDAVDLLTDAEPFDEVRNERLSAVQRYAIVLAAVLAFALLIGLSLSLLPPAPVLTATAIR